MKRVDRFVLSELLPLFLYGVIAFTALVLGVGAIYRVIRLAMDYGFPLTTVGLLVVLRLPEVIAYTLPMAILFAILLGFSRMSNDQEITAFRAAGVSFLRLLLPVLVLAFLVSLIGVLFNDTIVPVCNAKFNKILDTSKSSAAKNIDNERGYLSRITNGDRDTVLFARSLKRDTLHNVTYIEYQRNALRSFTTAQSARWQGRLWVFNDGFRTEFSSDGSPRNVVKFPSMNIIFKQAPIDLKRRNRKIEIGDLSIRQTREWIAQLQQAGAAPTDIRKLTVDYHSKISIPFAAFIFALIAAPLGLRPQRANSSLGMGLSLIIILIYYISQQLFRGLGQSVLQPALAAWLPNIVMLVIGSSLLTKSNR